LKDADLNTHETESGKRIVMVVDDDDVVRQSLVRLLQSADYQIRSYASAETFLAAPLPDQPACLILDMKLPDSSGLDVVETMAKAGATVPVICITGYGSIPMSVQAMKAGAVEFLTKPVPADTLLKAVQDAIARDESNLEMRSQLAGLRQRYESLTSRERQVFELAAGGLLNKQIASSLGVSEITAKVHKRNVMEKMQTRTLADLVRVAERLDAVQMKTR
jgi:FixJ family two-component response regulator